MNWGLPSVALCSRPEAPSEGLLLPCHEQTLTSSTLPAPQERGSETNENSGVFPIQWRWSTQWAIGLRTPKCHSTYTAASEAFSGEAEWGLQAAGQHEDSSLGPVCLLYLTPPQLPQIWSNLENWLTLTRVTENGRPKIHCRFTRGD